MSVLDDARRHLWLGVISCDDSTELLKNLVAHFERYGINDKLYREKLRLQDRLVDAEARLSEANGKALVMASQIARLEAALKTATECQTHPVQQLASMKTTSSPSPECEPDLLSDPHFTPCRNERCGRQGLHAEGQCTPMGRRPRKRKVELDA